MKIVLDDTLEPTQPRLRTTAYATMRDQLARKFQPLNRWGEPVNSSQALTCLTPLPEPQDGLYPTMGFIDTVSLAYCYHLKLTINPQDIWFIVLCEIGKIIKKYPEQCRHLFTTAKDKVTITVETNDPTQIDLESVISILQHLIPTGTPNFIPELSTMTPGAKMALNAAFCDAVSPYYNYMTMCCGIPEIQLNGTHYDWKSLDNLGMEIARMFEHANINDAAVYMTRVSAILSNIADTFDTPSGLVTFWKGIFTQKNVGSGGEQAIDGWITQLIFEQPKVKKLENFQSAIAVVSYKNAETQREFKGIYGAFETRLVDGYLHSDFTNFVFE